MDRGPRTGVTEAVSLSALDFVGAGGAAAAGDDPWITDLG